MNTIFIFAGIFLIIGYFFGCFSTGYVIGKIHGVDIRTEGSGNIGTTNALRTMGVKSGVVTLCGDLLKTLVPTLLVRLLFCPLMGYNYDVTYAMTLFVGMGVVIGHNFPFYLKFKGGKGIAVSAAVIIATATESLVGTLMVLGGIIIFALIVIISKYVSLGSLVVMWFIPVYTIVEHRNWVYFVPLLILGLLFTALAYIKHAGNIKRLIAGTERKLELKKSK